MPVAKCGAFRQRMRNTILWFMMQVIAMLYLLLKAGHVICVVFWMAGLFMLPRFFVYHQELPETSP